MSTLMKVCSNCSLRSSCDRAYLVTNKEDEARTIDVMRVLLTYGFDPINESVTNKSLPKQKTLKTIVRKLLHEVVKLSAVPRDPNIPPPVIKKPPPKVKQPPPTPKRRVGRDDVEMKKGDWVCPKCDFMNFAKNTVCLQCDAKRPKRQLLPGEWECPECNFLNYRRNMACFHCDCKRPPEEFNENKMEERQPIHKTRFEKIPDRSEVSNAWNFDFDDNESDGADVAAFEYADPARMDKDPLGPQAEEPNFRGPGDFNRASRNPMAHEREYSEASRNRHGTGFDDFADEDDDLDSYELDTGNSNNPQASFSNNFSRHRNSEWENGGDYDDRRNRASYPKSSRGMRKNASFSGSEDDELDIDSDDEITKRPKWKSSHVADASRGRRQTGQPRGLTYGSDEDFDIDSDGDDDDFGSNRRKGNKQGSGRRNNREISDFEESENDEVSSRGNRFGRKKTELGGRNNNFRGRGDYESGRNSKGRSNSDSPRRFQGNDRRTNNRGGQSGNFKGSKRGFDDNGGSKFGDFKGAKRGFEDRRPPKSCDYQDSDPGEFRNSRRVIER